MVALKALLPLRLRYTSRLPISMTDPTYERLAALHEFCRHTYRLGGTGMRGRGRQEPQRTQYFCPFGTLQGALNAGLDLSHLKTHIDNEKTLNALRGSGKSTTSSATTKPKCSHPESKNGGGSVRDRDVDITCWSSRRSYLVSRLATYGHVNTLYGRGTRHIADSPERSATGGNRSQHAEA
jgi:hypothetical protein